MVAKTHKGTSWFSIQSRVSKAQETKGILNVFGAYDHTPTTRCEYTDAEKRQFLDFITRADQKYVRIS